MSQNGTYLEFLIMKTSEGKSKLVHYKDMIDALDRNDENEDRINLTARIISKINIQFDSKRFAGDGIKRTDALVHEVNNYDFSKAEAMKKEFESKVATMEKEFDEKIESMQADYDKMQKDLNEDIHSLTAENESLVVKQQEMRVAYKEYCETTLQQYANSLRSLSNEFSRVLDNVVNLQQEIGSKDIFSEMDRALEMKQVMDMLEDVEAE